MIDFDNLSTPVQELYYVGENSLRGKEWLNYSDYGITSDNIPELIQIIRDFHSFWFDDQYEDEQALTPIHAWRALGQLKAKEAIDTLIFLAHENEEYSIDWIGEDIPVVMGMIGPDSIPSLMAYLNIPEKNLWSSITVAHCLEKIGNQYPQSRDDCIAVLQGTLEDFLENDETLNGFLISFLADLNAVEALPLVERAYKSGNVDISIMGDFEDFQINMGLLEDRLTPPLKYQWIKDPEREWEAYRESQRQFEQLQKQNAEQAENTGGQAKKTRRSRRKKKPK